MSSLWTANLRLARNRFDFSERAQMQHVVGAHQGNHVLELPELTHRVVCLSREHLDESQSPERDTGFVFAVTADAVRVLVR